MLKPRKLLAAAAFASLAACGGAARPNLRTQAMPPPVTEAAVDPAPTPTPAAEPAVVETTVVASPAPEAAAPRCDENGRPLAGNVRTKGAMDDCS